MAYQGLIFQGYECEFGFWCIYCGFGSGGAEIKASVNPAMDREFVGIGVQSSSVMNMNLDLVLTHISREMRNGSAEIKASVSECDIRENFDTNECPIIFVSKKLHE